MTGASRIVVVASFSARAFVSSSLSFEPVDDKVFESRFARRTLDVGSGTRASDARLFSILLTVFVETPSPTISALVVRISTLLVDAYHVF